MKSSMRTSPGWIGSISSVVVNDLHLLWSGVCPSETDPSLVIDPDAVLTSSVALERLESVTGWDAEVFEHLRRSHLTKLAQCHPEDSGIMAGTRSRCHTRSVSVLPNDLITRPAYNGVRHYR